MGKKKDKEKNKDKDRVGRKDLEREVQRLEAENEALRARLEKIAEIAASDGAVGAQPALAVLNAPDN